MNQIELYTLVNPEPEGLAGRVSGLTSTAAGEGREFALLIVETDGQGRRYDTEGIKAQTGARLVTFQRAHGLSVEQVREGFLRANRHARPGYQVAGQFAPKMGDDLAFQGHGGLTTTATNYTLEDLAVVVTHWNPCGYLQPVKNLVTFARQWESNPDWPVVHLVNIVPDESRISLFLDAWGNVGQTTWNVHCIPGNIWLWQKEAAINAAVARFVPQSKRLIAWIDGDVIFEREDWPQKCVDGFNQGWPVMQLFDRCQWLKEVSGLTSTATVHDFDRPERVAVAAQRVLDRGADLHSFSKSHPGFAWAAHRQVFDLYGLYDRMVTGSGDMLFAAACHGVMKPGWLRGLPAVLEDYERWARRVAEYVRGQVGCIPGTVRHLWHGNPKDRQYRNRLEYLEGFEPNKDVANDAHGLLTWTNHGRAKPNLAAGMRAYFERRQEDGETQTL